MEKTSKPVKEKRRNSEKRKEKSRDAARCRRSKESEIFNDLAKVLPLPPVTISHLDKASIMRLVIAHLRLKNIFEQIGSKAKLPKSEPEDTLFLDALGGIVLVISLEGDIVYVSSNVAQILGLTQVDLLGQSIFDVSHPCDHSEFRDVLNGKTTPETGLVSAFTRMKCTLTQKGRNVNLKSATYKALHFSGKFIALKDKDKEVSHFVSIGSPIPHPVNIEMPLGSYTFLSKHSLDMKYTYADERMESFLGYSPESLIGKSLYDFHHVQDNKGIAKAFKSLFAKGQSETGLYRFLTHGGGYVWVYTQATLIYNDSGVKPNSVVCVNHVISERHNDSEIFSSSQLEESEARKAAEKPAKPAVELPPPRPILATKKVFVSVKKSDTEKSLKVQKEPPPLPPVEPSPRPLLATATIFAPRTEEMNKGYLMFSDDDSGITMLKDEPEDLTHLAPTAGDTCIPLTPPFFETLFIPMSENYCPLINEEKDSPFFPSYRDDVSSGSVSPALSHSPGGCSLPSLCSLNEENTRFEDTTMKSLFGLDQTLDLVDSESDDLSIKAPYIPMNEGDDLPLLMNSDFLWSVNFDNTSSTASTSSCSPSPVPESEKVSPSLASLLGAGPKDLAKEYTDHGGGDHNETIISSPMLSKEIERRKRSSPDEHYVSKKRKQQPSTEDSGGGNSVLMNLLVAGCDVSAGYICMNPQRKTPMQHKATSQARRNS